MSDAQKGRVNEAIERGGTSEVHPPERVNATKGTTSYPLGDVKRTPSTVRMAIRRWHERNPDAKVKFKQWKGMNERGERCVVVKRIK